MVGSNKEVVFGQGEVETFLPWPLPLEDVPRESRA